MFKLFHILCLGLERLSHYKCKYTCIEHCLFMLYLNLYLYLNLFMYVYNHDNCQGLGRRRIDNSTNRYRRNLLTWVPHRIDLEKGPPRSSVYKVDYRGVPSEPLKQQIVKRPKTSFDDDLSDTTSYRYAYGSDNPNKQFLSAMSNTELVTARKQKMSTGSGKESVAGCMSWYRPQSPKPIIQTSTSMSEPCLTQTAQASDA